MTAPRKGTKAWLQAEVERLAEEVSDLQAALDEAAATAAASSPSADTFVLFKATGAVPGGVVTLNTAAKNPPAAALRSVPHTVISESEYEAASKRAAWMERR